MKCVLVGDNTVGKTSLILAQVTGEDLHEYIPSIYQRPNHHHHEEPDTSVEVDGRNVGLHLWDTVEYNDYDRLRALSYPNTDVFLICFSLENRISYEDVYSKWYPEVTRYCPSTPIVLVGLQQDRRNYSRGAWGCAPITRAEGEQLRDDIGAVQYVECSSWENKGVLGVFQAAARAGIDRYNERLSIVVGTKFNVKYCLSQ